MMGEGEGEREGEWRRHLRSGQDEEGIRGEYSFQSIVEYSFQSIAEDRRARSLSQYGTAGRGIWISQ